MRADYWPAIPYCCVNRSISCVARRVARTLRGHARTAACSLANPASPGARICCGRLASSTSRWTRDRVSGASIATCGPPASRADPHGVARPRSAGGRASRRRRGAWSASSRTASPMARSPTACSSPLDRRESSRPRVREARGVDARAACCDGDGALDGERGAQESEDREGSSQPATPWMRRPDLTVPRTGSPPWNVSWIRTPLLRPVTSPACERADGVSSVATPSSRSIVRCKPIHGSRRSGPWQDDWRMGAGHPGLLLTPTNTREIRCPLEVRRATGAEITDGSTARDLAPHLEPISISTARGSFDGWIVAAERRVTDLLNDDPHLRVCLDAAATSGRRWTGRTSCSSHRRSPV